MRSCCLRQVGGLTLATRRGCLLELGRAHAFLLRVSVHVMVCCPRAHDLRHEA